MKTIAEMIGDVIRREGGYVDHPADRGGPTKYGITLATLEAWREKRLTARDVKTLPVAEARSIYLDEFYRKPRIDKLPPSIQPFVFDAAVHHGPVRAIKLVQQVCAATGLDPGPIDGIVGPRTIDAAMRCDRAFLDTLIVFREDFFEGIVADDPSQRVFLAGWMNRLDEFRA